MVICKDKECKYCIKNKAYITTICEKGLSGILNINEVGICEDKIIEESEK